MEIDADGWLSRVAGSPVFRVLVPVTGLTREMCVSLATHADAQTEGMYYVKFSTALVETVKRLTEIGFYPVDVSLTLRLAPGSAAATPVGDLAVAEARVRHQEAVLAIASSCFHYSRFHLDPLISRELAGRIKREWVQSYISKERGERLWVVLEGGHPVGFLAVLLRQSPAGERTAVVDLIGVDNAFQRRGAGKLLVGFFVRHYGERCDMLEVGTQAANVPSLRLYEGFGFRLAGSAYVMHRHVGRPTHLLGSR